MLCRIVWSWTALCCVVQDRVVQDRVVLCCAGLCVPGPCYVVQDRVFQDRVLLCCAGLCGPGPCCVVQDCVVQDRVVLCFAGLCGPGPCCVVLCRTVWSRTVLCCVVQVLAAERETAAVMDQLTHTRSTLTWAEEETRHLTRRLEDTARQLAEAQVPTWTSRTDKQTHQHRSEDVC